jgi:hypothetical protein
MRITTAGNVGIGTTSIESGFKLHVTGNGFFSQSSGTIGKVVVDNVDQRLVLGAYFEAGVGQYSYISSTNNAETGGLDLRFRTGTDERMTIASTTGNVGIGTTSPAAKLDVIGTQKLINSVVVNSSTQTIVTNPSDGIAGLCWIRNADVGGQALVLWDASFGLTIVSQLGSIFTTSSPSATQIQLSVGGSSPYYIQAIAGSSRNGNTLRTSAINNH